MGDMGSTVLMLVLMGAAFYFLLIRPQQKRAKKQAEMTNALAPGARVMLSSGVFGTIRHLGDRQAIIEIAPGIEMTVVKQAIMKIVDPSEEEFEYEEEAVIVEETVDEELVREPTNEEIDAFFHEESSADRLDDETRPDDPGSDDSPSK